MSKTDKVPPKHSIDSRGNVRSRSNDRRSFGGAQVSGPRAQRSFADWLRSDLEDDLGDEDGGPATPIQAPGRCMRSDQYWSKGKLRLRAGSVEHSYTPDWESRFQSFVALADLSGRLSRQGEQLVALEKRLQSIESTYQELSGIQLTVPISTFAPEPFELIKEFSVVVRAGDEQYVATLFDANLSTSGETPEEAVANLKELLLAVFKDFDYDDNDALGPMMIRQKAVLTSLMRRK